MKRIAWITPESYLDTDFYIVPLLCKEYQIDWFIIYKDEILYKSEICNLRNIDNLSIISCQQKYRFRSMKTAIFDIKLFFRIRRCQYDVIYAGMFGFPYFHLLSSLILKRDKMVIAAHNVNTPKGAINYRWAKLYADYVLSIFKNFHTFSISQHDLLLQMHPKKNVMMAPFLLKDYGKPTNVKSNLITFLTFGNIRDYKRIDVLIIAAQNVYEQTGRSFRVIIAGSCDDWTKYQRLIKYPRLFDLRIGRVDNKDIPNLFGESHYFVTPYQDIAQSGSVIVGINYNCPIIASDLDAFREYIKDGETGFLIKPADVNDLTKVMRKIVESNNECYDRLRNGVEKLKKRDFATHSIVNKYISFFNKI